VLNLFLPVGYSLDESIRTCGWTQEGFIDLCEFWELQSSSQCVDSHSSLDRKPRSMLSTHACFIIEGVEGVDSSSGMMPHF